MVPRTVLTRSGPISLNTARPVNTVQPRTAVNIAGPMKNVINNAYSTARRPFNKITAANSSNFTKKVNTVKGTRVNTARPKAVLVMLWEIREMLLRPQHGNPQQYLKNKGVIDSGCSRYMIGNRSYLTDYEEINRGFVTFGGNFKGGKITGKGKIRTGKLDFEDVCFVKELKFNLFSVSQMCDKKNSVLFIDTECVVLSPDFKLTDESHVLLKVPRKDNMYSVDLKNVVPQGGLTCLFAKATPDESNLWHRRLGHVNFKTMNKLVRGNLVRGLPLKLFEINQTCIACQKGKQHKASCKTKTISSISQPLQMLHMDLFGLTFVKSLMKKMYCLVVTDDFSRFSWVFFLATKDETSEILKTFITGIENLINLRVKVIRCDNGTEFKNRVMNQFYEMKGIKREFSVARTPQQNGVAERKNRTLIEATRTMLADSKLPTTFWAEAVNTACRKPALSFMRPFGCPVTILNTIDHLGKFDGKADEGFFVGYSTNSKAFRVFNSRTRIVEENLHVQFSENTPNIIGSGPNWLFDIDALTKSMNYKPVVAGNQSNGNAGTKACNDAGKARMETVPGKDYILLPMWPADPLFSQDSKSSPDAGFKPLGEEENKDAKDPGNEDSEVPSTEKPRVYQEKDDNVSSTNNVNIVSNTINNVSLTVNTAGIEVNVVDPKSSIELPNDPNMPELEDIVYSDNDEDVGAEDDMKNLDAFMLVSPIPTTRIHKDHPIDQIIRDLNSAPQTRRMTKNLKEHGLFSLVQQRTKDKDFQNFLFACFLSQEEPKKVIQALKDPSWIEAMQDELLQFKLQKVWALVDLPNGKRAICTKWVYRNKKDERGIVIKNKARLVAQGYTQEEGIDYDEIFGDPYGCQECFSLLRLKKEVYVCQPLRFEDPDFRDRVYKVEKALYGLHQAPRACYETLSTYLLENGFQRGQIDKTLFIKRDQGDILIVHVYVDDIIFGSTKKKLCTEFEKMMHKKFQMSSMGELTLFLGLQVNQKEDGIFIRQDKYVTEILNKIGFSDVKIANTPMETHKPLLKDADGKDVDEHMYRSMIGSLIYLTSSRPDIILISWQCKKKTVVANSTTKVEYIAALNCCGQVLWIQNQLLDYGYNFMQTTIHIDNKSTICIVKNPVFHSKTKHIEIRHRFIRDSNEKKLIQMIKIHTDQNVADLLTKAFDIRLMGYEKLSQKLTFYKAFFSPQWKLYNFAMPKKSKKKNTEVPQPSGSTNNVPNENVPTTSNDPLLSDSEIASLKKKVKKLERRNYSRTLGLKRLRKVGSVRRVESSDEASLGDQEDASKQVRKIADIDADAEVTLINETRGTNDDNLMFDTCVLNKQEVEVEKVVSTAEVTTESATTTTIDKLTLAQTLIEIKAAKPKVRRVMIQETSKFNTTTTTTTLAASKPSQDKGKAKMIKSEKPLKKKDQIMYDQEVALNLQAQLQAELEEEERLTRQKEEEANIALIESWDNTQAMMDVDYQMAQQLQAKEQEQLSIEEKYNNP
ncbi:putative ribonuclease H-like domain-containing protein [Tanacetum coccineum]